MEIGLAILLFVCMTALLYVLLSLKITRQVDLQMKEFYKTRIHADIQEFYREMEGYAGLLETRIKQFKLLVAHNEEVVRTHETAITQPLAQMPEDEPEIETTVAPQQHLRRQAENKKKSAPEKKGGKHVELPRKATTDKTQRRVQTKIPSPEPVPITSKGKAAKPVAPPPAPPVSVNRTSGARAAMPRAAEPSRVAVPVQQFARPPQPFDNESDDSAIAEELMKDLFAQDEVNLSKQAAVKQMTEEAALPGEMTGERTMANFFSRIGKGIEPFIFGDKATAAKTDKAAAPVKNSASSASQSVASKPLLTAATKPPTDFSEVLRRAEQIKAEKKAERERAEVDARAEFYATGDMMSQVLPPARRPSQAASGDALTARSEPVRPELRRPAEAPAAEPARLPAASASAPQRNSLVVKDLDQHTISFLIDSLVKDNGYRKQALRALTENNISLAEIARLSKIDVGELELMRQLGRF